VLAEALMGRDGGRSITDVELVVRVLEGSERAFQTLVERYERPIFGLIVRMVKNRELAEDLAQETFIKAYRALGGYDHRRKFSSWLFKIAHNATIDHLRRSRLAFESLDDADEDGPARGARVEDPSAPSPE
jgi:RNA polymerase sigma-70 factor, ECF subfamily